MYLSEKVRIYPNKEQINIINRNLGAVRFVYNHILNYALENKIYREDEWKKELQKLIEENPFLKEVFPNSFDKALIDLSTAIKVYRKDPNKIPKPRIKNQNESFRIGNSGGTIKIIDKNHIFITGIGTVKFSYNLLLVVDRIANVTVSLRAGAYYCAICSKHPTHPDYGKGKGDVAIDTGVRKLIVTSDGKIYLNVDDFKYYFDKIDIWTKRLATKEIGSKNREKCRIKLSKAYLLLTNSIKYIADVATTDICKSYHTIYIEDIDVNQLIGIQEYSTVKRKLIATSIGLIYQMLYYKAQKYGCEIIKINRNYPSSQICSACESAYKVGASEVYKCPNCGLVIDRDLNAAKNILRRGRMLNKRK